MNLFRAVFVREIARFIVRQIAFELFRKFAPEFNQIGIASEEFSRFRRSPECRNDGAGGHEGIAAHSAQTFEVGAGADFSRPVFPADDMEVAEPFRASPDERIPDFFEPFAVAGEPERFVCGERDVRSMEDVVIPETAPGVLLSVFI